MPGFGLILELHDVTGANQLLIAAGMGKPTRNELLAEYYLHAAGRDQSTARGLRLLDAAVSGRLIVAFCASGDKRRSISYWDLVQPSFFVCGAKFGCDGQLIFRSRRVSSAAFSSQVFDPSSRMRWASLTARTASCWSLIDRNSTNKHRELN
jgi:hypothetical protein